MARYKASNKNIYGLKDGLAQTLLVCSLLAIAFTLAVTFLVVPLFHGGPIQKDALPVGQMAAANTPMAQSIADMERMTDGFTFYSDGAVLNHDTFQVGPEQEVYHYLTLESGETVIAHINKKNLTKMGTIGIYRLPIGVWREWDPPEEARTLADVSDVDHYIDMVGDSVRAAALQENQERTEYGLIAWAFVLFNLAGRAIVVRKWKFAPALLWSRDPLLPRNDMECWCAATYALWSHCYDKEGFPLITGTRASRKQLHIFHTALADSWDIHNREEGLQTVHELTDRWAGRIDPSQAGWDLCRATQLLAMLYLVKWIDRDELDLEFSRAGRVIQRSFSGWDSLMESYLQGFCVWVEQIGYDVEYNRNQRLVVYERMKRQSLSPYSIPWDTDLSWPPEHTGHSREFTKKLLRSYRGDL